MTDVHDDNVDSVEDVNVFGADDTTKQPFVGPLSLLLIEIEKFRSILGSP